jgi:hypothetical protein
MPLQNRVNPYGTIFRSPARGTFMGNRGLLHDENREIVRQFKVQRWIACCLEFRGRTRSVMSPGRYTELFFLDEAVAFAAGHRPCAECRRERFAAFQHAWKRRDNKDSTPPASALQIDAELHRSRIDRGGRKVTYEAELNSLPNGCFIEIGGSPFLIWNNALLLWTPEGYARKEQQAGGSWVTVLTPQPIVACFAQGYVPQVHNSGHAL